MNIENSTWNYRNMRQKSKCVVTIRGYPPVKKPSSNTNEVEVGALNKHFRDRYLMLIGRLQMFPAR